MWLTNTEVIVSGFFEQNEVETMSIRRLDIRNLKPVVEYVYPDPGYGCVICWPLLKLYTIIAKNECTVYNLDGSEYTKEDIEFETDGTYAIPYNHGVQIQSFETNDVLRFSLFERTSFPVDRAGFNFSEPTTGFIVGSKLRFGLGASKLYQHLGSRIALPEFLTRGLSLRQACRWNDFVFLDYDGILHVLDLGSTDPATVLLFSYQYTKELLHPDDDADSVLSMSIYPCREGVCFGLCDSSRTIVLDFADETTQSYIMSTSSNDEFKSV
jgi:hypothetical protein